MVGRHELVSQLVALGVAPGSVLLVHSSFRAVRPVEGGPAGLIRALREALGTVRPAATMVVAGLIEPAAVGRHHNLMVRRQPAAVHLDGQRGDRPRAVTRARVRGGQVG